MTRSRRVPIKKKNKRAHNTVHRRTMTDSSVRELVSELQQGWGTMGTLERGERLGKLSLLGCSTRGLEAELQQSATSIRRHIVLAGLPEQDREAIESGASAKKILARKADADRYRRRAQRVIEDRKTGALSDDIASVILEACRMKNWPCKAPVSSDFARQFFSETLRSLYRFETNGSKPARISKKLSLKRLLNKTRPPNGDVEPILAHQADWLASVVWAKALERPIWERAIQKAERRFNELTPQKRPIEIWRDNQRRLAKISTPPFRPMYLRAALSLERQGKSTRSTKRH